MRHYGGPNHGLAGLRARAGAAGRALTCSALKPQGFRPPGSRSLRRVSRAAASTTSRTITGSPTRPIRRSPRALEAIADALRAVERETGRRTRYVPSLTGDLDALRAQIAAAKEAGIDAVMVQPMIMGLSNFAKLVRENPDLAFFAHPTLAGAARIAPPLLFGKIFRMLGADALVFPNHGGRFGYSPETCRRDRRSGACADWHGLQAAQCRFRPAA